MKVNLAKARNEAMNEFEKVRIEIDAVKTEISNLMGRVTLSQ